MSVSGYFVPPFVIFLRANRAQTLGAVGGPHSSGRIQNSHFTKWSPHFIQEVKRSDTLPVLLILDSHYSHVCNVDVVDMTRNNHVIIVSLSQHSTHNHQPQDKIFTGPLKAYICKEICVLLQQSHSPVTTYGIIKL